MRQKAPDVTQTILYLHEALSVGSDPWNCRSVFTALG